MSITKLKTLGTWALPINTNPTDRRLNGRVIFGMLTGTEGPDQNHEIVVTSAKDQRRR